MAQTVPVISSPQANIKSGVRVTRAETASCKGRQKEENEDKEGRGERKRCRNLAISG